MEPILKKSKITGHFRVALKPRDTNAEPLRKIRKNQENQNPDPVLKQKIEVITILDDDEDDVQTIKPPQETNLYIAPSGIHPDVVDHDKLLIGDIRCEPHYAWDSFEYDRQQELRFKGGKYLEEHQITPHIRAGYVDWLVSLQDKYGFEHESLYTAVKIADQYLMKKSIPKHNLQLLYMTSILISSKFDERLPPFQISDLIQRSRGKYNRRQIIGFEIDILSTLNFNIRFPLSYGFLRRFARCTRSDLTTLHLARYLLESSLLDYEMIEVLESKIAAACLLLAFEMLHLDGAWSQTAEFYTGYKQEELYPLLTKLNDMITNASDTYIRRKYNHENFLSVARTPPLPKSWLLMRNRAAIRKQC